MLDRSRSADHSRGCNAKCALASIGLTGAVPLETCATPQLRSTKRSCCSCSQAIHYIHRQLRAASTGSSQSTDHDRLQVHLLWTSSVLSSQVCVAGTQRGGEGGGLYSRGLDGSKGHHVYRYGLMLLSCAHRRGHADIPASV